MMANLQRIEAPTNNLPTLIPVSQFAVLHWVPNDPLRFSFAATMSPQHLGNGTVVSTWWRMGKQHMVVLTDMKRAQHSKHSDSQINAILTWRLTTIKCRHVILNIKHSGKFPLTTFMANFCWQLSWHMVATHKCTSWRFTNAHHGDSHMHIMAAHTCTSGRLTNAHHGDSHVHAHHGVTQMGYHGDSHMQPTHAITHAITHATHTCNSHKFTFPWQLTHAFTFTCYI